jgi:hypothetical protein
MSNFLGDVYEPVRASALISGSELIEREGVDLQKGMTFRDLEERIAVFLVLPHDSEYFDRWDPRKLEYTFRGHDSVTVESGYEKDQIGMYASGRLSENGKFYKAATAYRDGVRPEPLQVQVYEKIASGLWYDKGIFNLTDAAQVEEGGRRVFSFTLVPANLGRLRDDAHHAERMLSASEKSAIWELCRGRCARCGTQEGLRFMGDERALACATCRGEEIGLLG